MKQFTEQDILELDKFFRINLINSCSGFKSANLIGTKSKDSFENVAIFSSVTHIGSNPPLLGFFCRPTSVTRNTYENIKSTGVYTINHVNASVIEDAHHTSAKYDGKTSEFEKTSLTPEYKTNCLAPFVQNASVQIEMSFKEEYHIKANDTILVIGEIKNLYIQENILENDGFIDLTKAETSAINGLDAYTLPKLIKRLEYQRPKN